MVLVLLVLLRVLLVLKVLKVLRPPLFCVLLPQPASLSMQPPQQLLLQLLQAYLATPLRDVVDVVVFVEWHLAGRLLLLRLRLQPLLKTFSESEWQGLVEPPQLKLLLKLLLKTLLL
jgi:hypothetical protein